MQKKASLAPEDYNESRFLYSRLRLDHANQSIVLTTWVRNAPVTQNRSISFSCSYDGQCTKKSKVKLLTILPNLSTDTPSVCHSTPAKEALNIQKHCLERSPGCLGHSTGPWWRQQREGQKRSQSRSLWTALNHPFPENTFVNLCLTFV